MITCQALLAKEEKVVSGEIYEFGVYELIGKKDSRPSILDTAGYTSHIRKPTSIVLTKQTEKIPLVKGTHFGFKFAIHGLPPGEKSVVKVKYEHPLIVRPDGKKSEGFALPKSAQPVDGVTEAGIFYSLSEDYELQAGKWILSVLHNDETIVTKTFELVNP